MQAVILSQNDYQVKVRCPYCFDIHKHGLGGRESIEGEFRGSDCHKGDYIVVSSETALANLKRKKEELLQSSK